MVNRADLYSISMIASNVLDLVDSHGANLSLTPLQKLSNLPMSVSLKNDGTLNSSSTRKVSKVFEESLNCLRVLNKNTVYSQTGVWLCNETMVYRNRLLHKLQHHC